MNQTTISHPVFLRSMVILSAHLCLHPSNNLFLSAFPTKILCAFLFFTIHNKQPTHPIMFELSILTIFSEGYKIWSLPLYKFSPFSCYCPPFKPKHLPRNPVFKSPWLAFFLSVRDQVSDSHKTMGKILVPYILILMFLDSKPEEKIFWMEL